MNPRNFQRAPAVYVMASERNGTIYIGVTSTLEQRVYQHKHNIFRGFTSENHVHTLVYYEDYATMIEAISREKQLKRWKREWKIRLIEKENPQWEDLAADWFG